MSAALSGGRGPILIVGALAVGALWWANRRKPPATAAAQSARRQLVNQGGIDRTTTYATPQVMAELFARGVVAITNGIATQAPKSAGLAVGTVEARDAIRASERSISDYWSGGAVSTVDPRIAAVNYGGDPYHSGVLVDSIPAGPVYDVSQQLNQYAWAEEW